MATRLRIPEGTPWDPERLLGGDLAARGGGRVMAEMARVGEFGDYAIQQQAIVDATMRSSQRSFLGLPGTPPMPQAGAGSVLPPGFQDPLTGAFKLPDRMRAQLRRIGADPDQIEGTVTRNLHERMGGDYQRRLLYGQDIAGAPDKSLQQAKEELFSKVARAVEADPSQRDRILTAAFAGPNADALLAEYDTRMAKEAHGGNLLEDLLGAGGKAAKMGVTSFGQIMSGLGGAGDAVRTAIGVLTGARKEDGKALTAADLGREVSELPRDFLNVFGMGVPGTVSTKLRSTSTAPGITQIQRSMRTRGRGDELASILVPFLGPSRAADQIPGPIGDVAAEILGFGGDIATDPTTYLTLGGGGLGKAATSAAGNVAARAKFLSHLGLDELIPRFATADEFAWEAFKREATETVGPKAMAEAEDVAKAFRVSAESAHGAQGWAGYRSLLDSQGLDADELIPRGLVSLGPDAKLASQLAAARGGVGLRGGIYVPFTKGRVQARAAFNLRSGGGGPQLGTWFTREGNRFHQLASRTLDGVAETFHYGGGGDREWVASNRGLFNATMEAATLGQGVEHKFQVLASHARGAEDKLKGFLRADDQNAKRLIDVIEKGERSDYWSLVPAEVREQGQALSDLLQQGRSLAAEDGVDIPMLREIADDDQILERYFPHKVKASIGQQARFPVTPTQVGAARARGLRAGSQITGPQGSTAMLTEGSWAEVQDVTTRILGEGILLDDNPAKIVQGWLHSVGKAAGLQRTYRKLTSSGLMVPDVWDVAPGQIRGAGDPVRGIWAQPADRARRAVEQAQAALGKTSAEATRLLGERAKGAAREAEMEAELAMYASRQADADSKISSLTKTRAERAEMLALARRNHATAKREAVQLHTATRRQLIDSTRAELGQTREARKLIERQTKALDAQHAKAMAEFDRGLAAQEEVLGVTPDQLRRGLTAEIRELGATAVGGRRPFNQVLGELRAAKHRLAQVEGGEMAAGRRDQLMARAAATVGRKRTEVLATQRKAGAEAADLNEAIAVAERAVQDAVKASDPAAETVARTGLTEMMARRTQVLQTAERASQEAAELWQLVDAGEAAARFADLREAEVLAHQAGATLEAQVGRMSENLRAKLTRMLEIHAADLVAEHNEILANAPRLKFLNRAMREFSVIDTSVAAIPPLPPGTALADFTQEYLARIEQRAGEIKGAWNAAVGDPTKAYQAARAEYTRQHSTLLARELDLNAQLASARQMDPRMKALATHQREGDQLNLFTAELHRNERELEWWLNNRDEVRKTQTLKALQLGAVIDENAELGRAVGAVQRLAESDGQAASQAMERAMSDPRIFNLLAPEVEHLAAVVGKLPFMEGGAAMPLEVSRVIERRLSGSGEAQAGFLKVLGAINSRWKRLVLATPGSMFRRWVGNTYNAVVLAGVRPASFGKAMDAIGLAREAKTLDKVADPKLRRYLELAFEYNIFEGQLSSLATDTYRFNQAGGHPVQRFEELLQTYALRGEDIARLAQFIDGLDAGMGPQASRMWTGKYHFFNNELTQAERTALRPLYPFYAYLRNNYALQFYTLFHQPGKISLYGTAMRDLSAQPAGSTEPDWVTQSGGFPITEDTWLQNTLLDTSPLGLPQTVLGIAARGPASGWSPTDLLRGELTSSLSPAITTGVSAAFGIDPSTGEKMYPQDLGPGAKPIQGALQALGLVNDAGKWNPRALAAFQNLAPMASRGARAAGGLTPAQGEQGAYWAISQLLGPGFQRQTERRGRSALGERGRVLDDLIASMNARGVDVPSTSDLTREERTALVLRQLGIG